MWQSVSEEQLPNGNVITTMENKKNGKAWRSDPNIANREADVFDYRPFATVAAIRHGQVIHVGISKCNPVDDFDPQKGRERAIGRARLQLALSLGLIKEERARRLRSRESHGGAFMMTLSPKNFADKFGIPPIQNYIETNTMEEFIEAVEAAALANHTHNRATSVLPKTGWYKAMMLDQETARNRHLQTMEAIETLVADVSHMPKKAQSKRTAVRKNKKK